MICFGGFAVVSVCNLRMLRRFWRLLKSLQTAKRRGCPPSMAVLAVLTVVNVCNLRMFHRFWRFRRSRRLQIFYRCSFCFSSLLPDTSILKPFLNYHQWVPPWFPKFKREAATMAMQYVVRAAMAPITPPLYRLSGPLCKDLSREKVWREGGKVLRLAFHLD